MSPRGHEAALAPRPLDDSRRQLSERSMASAEQPTDSNADQDGSVRLLFDRPAQDPFERTRGLRYGIRGAVGDVGGTGARLPVDIPRSTFDFLGNAFRLLLCFVQRAVQIAGTGSGLGHI